MFKIFSIFKKIKVHTFYKYKVSPETILTNLYSQKWGYDILLSGKEHVNKQ